MAEPPRRGSGSGRPGSGEQPRITQPMVSVDATHRQEKITPPAGTSLPPETRAIGARKAAKIIDDLIADGEPTRAQPAPEARPAPLPTETVPYSKAKFLNPNDPLMKTQHDARPATTRRVPGMPEPAGAPSLMERERLPAVTERDLPAMAPQRERLLTPTPPVERERVTTPMPAVSAQSQSHAQSQSPQNAPATIQQSAIAASGPPPADTQKTKVWVATHKLLADPDPRLILLREPDSPRAASFRVLRHRLAEQNDPRTIVVSSAEAGDGKTTCAVNLALALGECGRARVLLVEANLRAPTLAALFGFLPPECFSAQLERHRERPLDPWSVVEVGSPSLHVVAVKPGASTEGRPLLDGVAFGIAIDMLKRGGYDYLVLDTPPVLGSADVNLIEDFADGVLLAARSRKSSSRALRRAVEQLQPGKILGVTLLDA
ncbi:MAG TPA: P-loop NTPase [Polyangia bacterium]|nr:P-loop NTPase [Polyangia bacterium]